MFRVANWLREKLNKMVRKIDFPSFSYTPFQQRAYTHLSFMTSQKSLFKNHLKLAHVHVAQESFHSSQPFRNLDPVRALHSEENCSVELNIQCFIPRFTFVYWSKEKAYFPHLLIILYERRKQFTIKQTWQFSSVAILFSEK